MQINISLKGVEEALKRLDPKKIQGAVVTSLNRTVASARTEASSILRERFNVKKRDLDPKLTVMKANASSLSASLTLIGDPISLTKFSPVQVRGGIRTFMKQGMAQKKLRGKAAVGFGGVKTTIIVGRETLRKRAFMAIGKHGVPLVFERIKGSSSSERKGKEKLRALKLKRYPSLLKQPDRLARLKARIEEQWKKNFDHELKRRLGQI